MEGLSRGERRVLDALKEISPATTEEIKAECARRGKSPSSTGHHLYDLKNKDVVSRRPALTSPSMYVWMDEDAEDPYREIIPQ